MGELGKNNFGLADFYIETYLDMPPKTEGTNEARTLDAPLIITRAGSITDVEYADDMTEYTDNEFSGTLTVVNG